MTKRSDFFFLKKVSEPGCFSTAIWFIESKRYKGVDLKGYTRKGSMEINEQFEVKRDAFHLTSSRTFSSLHAYAR